MEMKNEEKWKRGDNSLSITYFAKVVIPIDDTTMAFIKNRQSHIYKTANHLMFKRLKKSKGDSFAFMKANPLISYVIAFNEKAVIVEAMTEEHDLLKHFKELAIGEVLTILERSMEIGNNVSEKRNLYIS